MENIYSRLAHHLFALGMGYPAREGLEAILKENFTPLEAEVALALPNDLIPLQVVGVDEIIDRVNLSREQLVSILDSLSQRGLIFSAKTPEGEKGYALLQRDYGFPQSWFWKGEKTPFVKKMSDLLDRYDRGTPIQQPYGKSKTPSSQFIPVNRAVSHELQAVYSYTMLEKVIEGAEKIAVAHCPCRIRSQLRGKGCHHLLEVCLKFDELAEYLIEREAAREVTKEEALRILKQAEEDGLVHFVDNALGDVKSNCNCCGCCCWALGPIKRRRVPRDAMMATYFIRETDETECIGCGNCVSVCPVEALSMGDDFPVVDEKWCVGCGLCVLKCTTSAARLRTKSEDMPPRDFTELHQKIREEKALK
jgi:ferredoxin/DNA-binding MarR family transcriptional regulator